MKEDLYLEKMKIAERLQALETTLVSHTAQMSLWTKKTEDLLNKHSEEIWGNGKPGLKTEVDRLIQVEEGRKWLFRVVVGAIAGLLAKAGFDIFKHGS